MMTRPLQLAHDDAIYWLGGAHFVEYPVSKVILKYKPDYDRALAYAQDVLRHLARETVPKEWQWYTTVASEDDSAIDVVVYRHTLYEQPAYREIKVWRAPHSITMLRLAPENTPHEVKDLPLHRLMYYGELARGALNDGILHVVL